MRTRFILSFIAALFMQFTTVSADNYTDGLMKLMNSDAMGLYTKSFEQMSQMPNVNAGYIQGQFLFLLRLQVRDRKLYSL